MPLLNADVVEHILDSYDHWWPRDLCRLVLVSSVWLEPVRKTLYASPRLDSYRSCHLLARTLQENRDLIPHVHGLDIRPESNSSWSHEEAKGEHLRGICPGVPRLLALVQLKQLTFGGDLASSAHQYLRMIASPQSLSSLSIISPHSRKPSPMHKQMFTWDGELALRFHALQVLTLDGLLVDVDDMHYGSACNMESDMSKAMRGATLKELHLREIDFVDHSGRLCALLRSPGSWHQLRSFTFTTEHCSPQHFDHFFSILACAHDSLEHLTFRTHSSDPLDATDITPLHQIRSLKTSHHLLSLEGFPETLSSVRELEVTGTLDGTHLRDLTNIITRKKSFPNLRRLVLDLSECFSIQRWLGLDAALVFLLSSCEGVVEEVEVLNPRSLNLRSH